MNVHLWQFPWLTLKAELSSETEDSLRVFSGKAFIPIEGEPHTYKRVVAEEFREGSLLLGRFEILLGMVGAYVFASAVLLWGRHRRGERLPPGSVPLEGSLLRKESPPPSNRWVQVTVSIGLELGALFGLIAIGLSVFDYWSAVPSYLLLDLPWWLNWAGLVGFWLVCIWGDLVMLYNVNYTPVTRGIRGRYVLATGGPYRFARHPMYLAKALQTIFVFMITGIWLSMAGAVFWVEIPRQAVSEEELMLKTFGEKYEKYCRVTGRFLPKLRSSSSGKR